MTKKIAIFLCIAMIGIFSSCGWNPLSRITGDFKMVDKDDKIVLSKSDFKGARLHQDEDEGRGKRHGVEFVTNEIGSKKLEEFSKKNVGKTAKMMLGDELIIEATISEWAKDELVVAGGWTEKETAELFDKICKGK